VSNWDNTQGEEAAPPGSRRPIEERDWREDHEAKDLDLPEPAAPRGPWLTSSRLLVIFGAVAILLLVAVTALTTLLLTGGGRSAGTAGPVAQAPQGPPQPRVEVVKSATYGDWVYTCVKAPGGTETRCSISQQLSDAKTKAPLFLWRVAQDGKGGLVGEWQTRSGVLVDRGIVLDAGTDKPVTIPFQACLPEGCRAVANLAADTIDKMAKATKASATVFPVGDPSGVELSVSVKGLADALAALKQ
jgi:invasion protein IalB